MNSLKRVLIQRDGLTEEEADKRISEAREDLINMIEGGEGDEAYDFCQSEFGLEPDYLEDLIG